MGIVIIRRYRVHHLQWPATRCKKAKKEETERKGPSVRVDSDIQSADKEVEEEIIPLLPETGPTVFALLRDHNYRLEEMHETDNKQIQQKLSQVYSMLIELVIKAKVAELDIPNCPFP